MGQSEKAKTRRETGNTYFESKRYELALKSFDAAILIARKAGEEDEEARKEEALALGNRAMTLIRLERYREALQDCNECILAADLNGTFATKASFRRALCLHKLGKLEDALEAYRNVRSKISKSSTITKCDKAIDKIRKAIVESKTCRGKATEIDVDSVNVRTKIVKLNFTAAANDSEGKTRGHPACCSSSLSERPRRPVAPSKSKVGGGDYEGAGGYAAYTKGYQDGQKGRPFDPG